MKRNIHLLLICLLILACAKESDSDQDSQATGQSNVADELLWGTWNFYYVTNTMEGTRTYVFSKDGHYEYADVWTVRDIERNIVSQEQDKHHGDYTVADYKKTGTDAAVGTITIGQKSMPFSITTDTRGNTYLLLNDFITYTKQTTMP